MDNNKQIEFNKTTFCRGLNATYGKIPVKLELYMDFQYDGGFIRLELFVGMEKMYRINEVGRFLEALEELKPYYFTKNFIFEPTKMFFERIDQKILEAMRTILLASTGGTSSSSTVVLDKNESERFFDYIWDDIDNIKFCRKSNKIRFENDISIKVSISKEESPRTSNDSANLMSMDYSEYGGFEPVSTNFRYIAFKDKRLIVKIPENKREIFSNLYNFKNEENVVVFRIGQNEKKLFYKNFIDKYCDELKISIDSAVKKEIMENRLLSRVYFDVAPKGIVSKIEFCYADKIINPLDDTETNKSFREFDGETEVISELKNFGFREYGRLFLLDDVEKIMSMLTDKLSKLKKMSEVYYSEDFKKLHVKNLSSLNLKLSEDGSVIHMNINLENVSDEELIELLEAINKGKKYFRLKSGSIINLSSIESGKLIDLLNSLDIDKNSINNGVFEIPSNRCLYIDNYLREKGMENVTIESKLGCLIKSISNPEDFEIELNDSLKGILRDYQMIGVKWLKSMANYSFGGILADDMGLGKTLQTLAFIASEKKRGLPCIVVAPTSIIYNWKMEAEKFTPELKVLLVGGIKAKRTLQICGCNEYDLVITSYGALKNDVEDYKKVKFSYVFIDEAQNIKNPMTLNANSVKSLRAKCCFALSGTPMENRLTEIWSIFDFIMPGYLFDRNKFVNNYEEPIIRDKNSEKLNELSSLIKPFIIRRLKRDVLSELPDKIETNYVSEMTGKQKKLYAAYYKDLKNELISEIEEHGVEKNQIEILSALTRLRQICAHPGTFLDNYDGGSCKLDLAMEIITESMSSGHSILIFSQFTKMLKIIAYELDSNNMNYYYLDGSMNPEDRAIEIENFNNDREAVFLISLKAGGTGLNLTKADIIIHFDPWWNPAVEDQASDRAHRIGQKNVVQVYKLLTEGTIEEKIAHLQERKRGLIESVIKPGENFLNLFSEDEIRELFGISE